MIIPGFSAYNIEADGVVTRISTGAIIKPHIIKNRNSYYARVSLRSDEGHIRVYNVLSLLALTYFGKPIHEGVVVAKDGNNLNTTLDNVKCTSISELSKQRWRDGSMDMRQKRAKSYDASSIEMVYEAMKAYDRPVAMTELSYDLQVPYATVRYSMMELRNANKVRKTKDGFEVIA